ncbi:hypothetical protein ACFQ48_19855 [Hymenobacter caeli]|uniref:ABC transporter permease n=1 Tax=Hymenobacter caeli TaxID=2735894 RepID=A0ABX2FW68_9BACT|nr:hypothetical protein [Hymenobacter caeli]NRT21217.1 hypothetical protein [Hymenobacter caeli]
MTPLATRLRAVLLFYRGVAPFTLGISALIVLAVLVPALREGRARGLLPMLLLLKLATGPAVWYLAEQLRPQQYWFYYNLGVSRGRLWAGVAVLDGLLFLGTAAAATALAA